MASLRVDNIDERLLQSIQQAASKHCRTVDGEVKAALEQVFARRPFDRDAWLKKARQLRTVVRPDPEGCSLAQSIADMRDEQAERG